jgi:hypothetical protein
MQEPTRPGFEGRPKLMESYERTNSVQSCRGIGDGMYAMGTNAQHGKSQLETADTAKEHLQPVVLSSTRTKGSATDRLHLNHRATPRLHTVPTSA